MSKWTADNRPCGHVNVAFWKNDELEEFSVASHVVVDGAQSKVKTKLGRAYLLPATNGKRVRIKAEFFFPN